MTNAELATSESTSVVDLDGEAIDRLQRRIDALKDRIDAAIPEGYDISALRASESDAPGEDVFEITRDERALVGLSGPFTAPGSQPQPGFTESAFEDDDPSTIIPGSAEDRLAKAVLIIVAAIALAAAAYFGGLWWAEQNASGDPDALGVVLAGGLALPWAF